MFIYYIRSNSTGSGDAMKLPLKPAVTSLNVSLFVSKRSVQTSRPDRQAFLLIGTFDRQTVTLPECPLRKILKAASGISIFDPGRRKLVW